MFNKAVFKQTVKANRVLWIIITAVLTAILVLVITQFDPSSLQQMLNQLQGSGLVEGLPEGEMLGNAVTILGILSQSFYLMIAVIVMLVYIIITANNLIAGEVDRGSMAYTLSTPIKRSSVIITKASYLIGSILLMVLIFFTAGIITVQAKYQLVWGVSYTNDIKEMAKKTEYSREELESDTYMVFTTQDLLDIGSEIRVVSSDTYQMYIMFKGLDKGLSAAADHLNIDEKDKGKKISEILASEDAMTIGTKASGLPRLMFQGGIIAMDGSNNGEETEESIQYEEDFTEIFKQVAEKNNIAITAAYARLEDIIKKPEIIDDVIGAMDTEITTEDFITALIFMSANQLLTQDKSITFSTVGFFKMNAGLFLLMFATSSISFIASAIFNLSKNSFALGAGVPLLFWVLQIVSNIDESLEKAKYLSLNTLYNPGNLMVSGKPFVVNFIVLFVIGAVLYVSSVFIFKKKDLPL